MDLLFCPACGSPVVMREAKYCELCGMDLVPVRKAMEKLKSRGSTVTEQMAQLVAPQISNADSEEVKIQKVLEFSDGDYAGTAISLFEGKNVKKDSDFAVKCLEVGVQMGNQEAELLTAKIELEGLYQQNKNVKHAQDLLLKLAQGNNMEAQYLLGNSLGDPSWYKKAAQQGHVDAMYKLGCHYANKMYMNKADLISAEQWLTNAADRKHYDAAYKLAYMYYENGDKFGKNIEKQAFEYAKRAAENGSRKACLLLSDFYSRGFGCNLDYELSEYWRDKSYDTI